MALFGENQDMWGLEDITIDIALRYPKESVLGPYCL